MICKGEGLGEVGERGRGNKEESNGNGEENRETDKAIALFVRHIGGKTGGQGLLKDGDISCSRGVVHAGCERDGFGGKRGFDAIWACVLCHRTRIATVIMTECDEEYAPLG